MLSHQIHCYFGYLNELACTKFSILCEPIFNQEITTSVGAKSRQISCRRKLDAERVFANEQIFSPSYAQIHILLNGLEIVYGDPDGNVPLSDHIIEMTLFRRNLAKNAGMFVEVISGFISWFWD